MIEACLQYFINYCIWTQGWKCLGFGWTGSLSVRWVIRWIRWVVCLRNYRDSTVMRRKKWIWSQQFFQTKNSKESECKLHMRQYKLHMRNLTSGHNFWQIGQLKNRVRKENYELWSRIEIKTWLLSLLHYHSAHIH